MERESSLTSYVNDDTLESFATILRLDQHVGTNVKRLAAVDEIGDGYVDDLSTWQTTAQQDGDEVRSRTCSCHDQERLGNLGLGRTWKVLEEH